MWTDEQTDGVHPIYPPNFVCVGIITWFNLSFRCIQCRWRWKIIVLGFDIPFLSSVALSLQHLCMEFSYHNPYVMPELAVTTQTFYIALNFLQLGFWNRVMVLQDWSHHNTSLIGNQKNVIHEKGPDMENRHATKNIK